MLSSQTQRVWVKALSTRKYHSWKYSTNKNPLTGRKYQTDEQAGVSRSEDRGSFPDTCGLNDRILLSSIFKIQLGNRTHWDNSSGVQESPTWSMREEKHMREPKPT